MTSFETLLAEAGFTKPHNSFEWECDDIRAVVDDQSIQFRQLGGSYGELGVFRNDNGTLRIEPFNEVTPEELEALGIPI